ncbi:hypothetical protein RND81_09G179000 [Saponaria officinalis]|uniref:Transmembrane protein 45B n=1 Tax=Saponaria officinalis TaxID=3572 RepID=A0AAW1INY7_SAPOF
MGTFLGHFVPGLALITLGLWHTFNTITSFHLKGSSNFIYRFWYPFNHSLLKLRELELILILSFSLLAIVLQVFDYPSFHLLFVLHNFEHATMFLHLALFTGFALCAELTLMSESVSSLTGILAASVFCQELFLLHFHSTDHVGLEGCYHGLLQLIVTISVLSAIATTIFPGSFPAALVLSISVVFQGCWFVNMGFMLWVPKLVPQGCFTQKYTGSASEMVHGGAVTCVSPEAEFRARALANLQFSWILAGILMFTAFSSLILTRKRTPGARQLTVYEQLQCRTLDSAATINFKRPLEL